MFSKLIICSIVLTACLSVVQCMTIEEMHKNRDTVLAKCSAEHNIPVEIIITNLMKNSPDPVDMKIKCFTYCVQEGMQNFKDGKFDYDTTLESIKMMPDEMQPTLTAAFEKCNKAIDGISDKCESAFVFTKCLAGELPPEFE